MHAFQDDNPCTVLSGAQGKGAAESEVFAIDVMARSKIAAIKNIVGTSTQALTRSMRSVVRCIFQSRIESTELWKKSMHSLVMMTRPKVASCKRAAYFTIFQRYGVSK